MRRPSNEDLLTAAEWLDVNEGEEGEKEACHATANWIRNLVDQNDKDRIIKQIAQEAGVSVARARVAWNNRKKN